MSIIAFWSNGKEETAKTFSIAAVATYMAMERNFKILVIPTSYNDNTLEECFWQKTTDKKGGLLGNVGPQADLTSGIEGLAKAMASNKATPEIITNYTKVVFKDRLEVLPGIKTDSYQEYEHIRTVYSEIAKAANKYYDLVFIDLTKGLDNNIAREMIELSDLVVVTLTQRLKLIDNYMELKQTEPLFQRNNLFALVGRYDKFSKFNAKNLTRYLGEKREISVIPYCTLFFEACNEGQIADYFLRFRKVNETDRNALFIQETQKTVDRMIYRLQELKMRR